MRADLPASALFARPEGDRAGEKQNSPGISRDRSLAQDAHHLAPSPRSAPSNCAMPIGRRHIAAGNESRDQSRATARALCRRGEEEAGMASVHPVPMASGSFVRAAHFHRPAAIPVLTMRVAHRSIPDCAGSEIDEDDHSGHMKHLNLKRNGKAPVAAGTLAPEAYCSRSPGLTGMRLRSLAHFPGMSQFADPWLSPGYTTLSYASSAARQTPNQTPLRLSVRPAGFFR